MLGALDVNHLTPEFVDSSLDEFTSGPVVGRDFFENEFISGPARPGFIDFIKDEVTSGPAEPDFTDEAFTSGPTRGPNFIRDEFTSGLAPGLDFFGDKFISGPGRGRGSCEEDIFDVDRLGVEGPGAGPAAGSGTGTTDIGLVVTLDSGGRSVSHASVRLPPALTPRVQQGVRYRAAMGWPTSRGRCCPRARLSGRGTPSS